MKKKKVLPQDKLWQRLQKTTECTHEEKKRHSKKVEKKKFAVKTTKFCITIIYFTCGAILTLFCLSETPAHATPSYLSLRLFEACYRYFPWKVTNLKKRFVSQNFLSTQKFPYAQNFLFRRPFLGKKVLQNTFSLISGV